MPTSVDIIATFVLGQNEWLGHNYVDFMQYMIPFCAAVRCMAHDREIALQRLVREERVHYAVRILTCINIKYQKHKDSFR